MIHMKRLSIIAIVAVVAIIIGVIVLNGGKEQTPQDPAPSSRAPAPGFENVAETVSPPSQRPSVQKGSKILMQAGNFFFSPQRLEAEQKQSIVITIQNTGLHTFTIDELGVNERLPGSGTYTVEFTPDKKGSFEYYCAVPGHREAGMVGVLMVN